MVHLIVSDLVKSTCHIISTTIYINFRAALALNFLTYDNPALGIRLLYPADWEKRDSKDIARSFGQQIGVTFNSPLENEFDMFSENLFVGESVVENISLAEFTISTIYSLEESSDINIANSSSTTLAGIPAYTVTYFFFQARNSSRSFGDADMDSKG
jgi:hypothetical protein